jgi:uncharacterized protein (TIGR02265 family)
MSEKQVKGTMLIDFVRIIRSKKNLDWNKHLKPEDWETINSLILPTKWYPFELYLRCAMASFLLLAKGNLETARLNGQVMAKSLFETTYKSIINSKDPKRGLKQFVLTYGSFFNFSSLKYEEVDEKHAKIHHEYDTGKDAIIPYCHQLMGMFDMLVQMTGGKNHNVTLSSQQWEGAPATTFDITWQ